VTDFKCEYPRCECKHVCRATGREVGRRSIDRFAGEYAFLSNFHPSPIKVDGLLFPTVEHAFQAAKTRHPGHIEAIRSVTTPGRAKRLGRQVPLRPDWEHVKIDVMEALLRKKFRPGTALREQLEATSPAELIEGNTWGDTFWGVCRGKGQNHLGELLMKIRDGEVA
jgi:ribA/ribD-fused uncharacterized protein